jgi:hypothetical protein
MATFTATQRGDLAESLLPVAAQLACIVHGEGGPEDVRQLLDGLGQQELTGLAVVLAGLVDPAQRAAEALDFLCWDERGLPIDPVEAKGTIRGLTGHRSSVVRIHDPRSIAHRMYVRGVHPEAIAAQVDVTERTIYRWVQAWRREARVSA